MRNSLLSQVAGVFEAFGEARRAVGVYHDLDRLSDSSLKQRGMSRGDIVAAAFRTAERRR